MSNFNYEYFPGYESEIICGPEMVNGTGQVSLKFSQQDACPCGNPDCGRQLVLFLMDADKVLHLAEWLADLAWRAKREQWREHNTLCG